MGLTLFIPREHAAGERRAAMSPTLVGKFAALGVDLLLEHGLGGATMPDAAFGSAAWADDAADACAQADAIAAIGAPNETLLAHCRPGTLLVGQLAPHGHPDYLQSLADSGLTAFALELVPRISRAQNMDVLSSQAAAAGYYGALVAATHLPRFFPMLTTAAGTIRPAKVLVIGAGVAGLQAIATARRLGAVVSAYDVRAAAREQVESLGAKFVAVGVAAEGTGGYARELTVAERDAQQAALAAEVAAADAVITTAMIPGRPAPLIITKDMVAAMKPGAVVVDLAADAGGNCELTQPGEIVSAGAVSIIGVSRPAAAIAEHASEMYARNLVNFLTPLVKDGRFEIDWNDEIYAKSCVARDGKVVFGIKP
ncbi:MAG TPA: NAD(P) transhydrogenase subunit alpha [Gammaproteobacteria bacterium]|nr:NAD(P) transhydrogenase subunit alpha [Gammaproteobacteria bacterium]